MQGTIVKGIGGFYYIKVDEGIVECKARGKFRHNELTPMVGDKVEITLKEGKGVIDKIYPRSNELIRPAVANVTQALVVFALKNPEINENLLNKFLINCEYNNLKVTVCFNKLDLISEEEKNEIVSMIKSAGYEIIFLKAKEGYGIDEVKEKLKNNVTVLCGPSGVGKSTILNTIAGRELMETGEVSEKLRRGKHTTRHSELIDMGDGFIVDTPGFSSFDLDFLSKDELQNCFPEFADYIGDCKFTGCLHYKEPGCAIKEAVIENKINSKRYEFYIKTLEEIMSRRNKQW
ncbi:ribosome small subunit-dependent GTPase A [Clostridiaceae bacterium UIB06]|uniref:Small ribosomal subunit biogenesis GTPase RsgA n=1 Tax=Clostridium thailandense TaxID=2794346 RepID=A0A949TT95_9CLOT|nr:ribosome small subunit-dependent GTPase A [Clostridium thailandense]MBV7271943.1 ribosome small subunit-dependent GTPase A [Clostridium thailandense]MCH5137169.1 ribosome small subunit-dependent GTPase A [Clostridiaceae bacterium UIB06]